MHRVNVALYTVALSVLICWLWSVSSVLSEK